MSDENIDYELVAGQFISASEAGMLNLRGMELSNERLSQQVKIVEASLGVASEAMRTSETIALCAMQTFLAVQELNAATRHFELQAATTLAKVEASGDVLAKRIDRLMDRCDRLVDQLLMIDVDTCSDRQMRARDQLIELATKVSDAAHAEMMRFMAM